MKSATSSPPLRRALRFLGWKRKPELEPIDLQNGRYQGGNAFLNVDLRVDETVSGVISADFFRSDQSGQNYVASIRTTPGERIELQDGDWEIIAEDEHGGTAKGTLSLKATGARPVTLSGDLFLNSAIHGLPSRRTISFSAEWQSAEMRTIGVELEREKVSIRCQNLSTKASPSAWKLPWQNLVSASLAQVVPAKFQPIRTAGAIPSSTPFA